MGKEEIKKEKEMSNKEFQWDDTLIKEMIYQKFPIPDHYMLNLQKALDEFKASKQPQYPLPKGYTANEKGEIKKEPKPDRNWEIVAWKHLKDGGISNIGKMHGGDDCIIWSVRSLYNDEVLTVGDKTNKGVIISFEYSGWSGHIYVETAPNTKWHLKDTYKLYPPSPSSEQPAQPKIKYQTTTVESYEGAAKPLFPVEDDIQNWVVDYMNKRKFEPTKNSICKNCGNSLSEHTPLFENCPQQKTEQPAKRKFKLLKDVFSMDLTAKAGDIGVLCGFNQVWFDNGRYYYTLEKINKLPDWFEEITEQPKEERFVCPEHDPNFWNCFKEDGRISHVKRKLFSSIKPAPHKYFQDEVGKTEQPKKERIEVSVWQDSVMKCLVNIGTKEPIPKEKFPAIKEAIEQVLNDDFRWTDKLVDEAFCALINEHGKTWKLGSDIIYLKEFFKQFKINNKS